MNIRYLVWTYKLREDQTRTASGGLVAQARARQPVKVMMQPWMLVLPWLCQQPVSCSQPSQQPSQTSTSPFIRTIIKKMLNASIQSIQLSFPRCPESVHLVDTQ